MKRWIAGLLVLLLTVALAGCFAGEQPVEKPAVSPDLPAVEEVEPSAPVLEPEAVLPPVEEVNPEPSPDMPTEEPPAEEPSSVPTEEEPVADQPPALPVEVSHNDGYFDHALFIGDSILEGVRQHVAVQRKEGTTLGEAKFLATTSGIGVADLVGDRKTGLYYRYKGEEKPLEQIVAEIAPNRIFLFLGLNDLAAVDPEIDVIISQYVRLVELLETICPEAQVIIMTNPPKVASTWLPDYTPNRNFGNELIDSFVSALIGMCEEQGIPCIDIHAAMENEAGVLPEEYCSDGFVHLNSAGSAAVVEALYEYADAMA